MTQSSMPVVVHGAMTLLDFWHQDVYRNQYVHEREFEHLYVRKGPMQMRFKDGRTKLVNCLQIANVAAKKPKTGAFGRLLAKIDRELGAPVFVENVTDPEAAAGLAKKYGFEFVNDYGLPFCFCLFRLPPMKEDSDE